MSEAPHNESTVMTLDQAVDEVLGLLTGLDLTYSPEYDRYRAIARQLNRALRANALEQEWSWYHSVETAGTASVGDDQIWLSHQIRPRIISDDAVQLVDENGVVRRWAYWLPRDSIYKYQGRRGLWASNVRDSIIFSRPFTQQEDGWDIRVPVMREPYMFEIPKHPEDPNAPLPEITDEIRQQPIDFPYPDIITLRAAYYYSLTDPVMQPRAQTLEAQYKDLMYQVIERDNRSTDAPYQNDFMVPVQSGLNGVADSAWGMSHPHSDERR